MVVTVSFLGFETLW